MTLTRRLATGAFYITLSNGVVRLLSIVTMPIMTSLLSPDAYGVTALYGTAIALVSVFALAGIDVTYVRAYHSNTPPCGYIVEHFCWQFAIISATIISLLAAITWWLLNRDHFSSLDNGWMIFLAIGIVVTPVHTMALSRARLANRYRAMGYAIIVAGILSPLTGIGIAVWWRQDAMALLLPMLLSYLLSILILGTPKAVQLLEPSKLPWHDKISLLKIGAAAIVTAPMYWLLSSSDRWFLQHYHGAEAVGVYSIGYSIAIIGMMLNNAIFSVWVPEASREFEKDSERAKVTLGRLMTRIVVVMALFWLMIAAVGGDVVRWLANERFHASSQFVSFIAGGVFFYGVSHLALSGLLLIKQLQWAAFWWFAGGLFSMVLNYELVPHYGGLGAAITQCASFAFVSIGILVTSLAKYRIRLEWVQLTLVLLIVLTAGIFLAQPWHPDAIASLLWKLPVGLLIALSAFWIIAPDWVFFGVSILRGNKLV